MTGALEICECFGWIGRSEKSDRSSYELLYEPMN